ncbi:MAG: polyprenyl synthetase family protein [Proteobacteria bacterium]|jgi:geranylgeranyl diphosphate synthase type II|nr:polyprenyl synthetase family protein [Pseudomonadota bacterium]
MSLDLALLERKEHFENYLESVLQGPQSPLRFLGQNSAPLSSLKDSAHYSLLNGGKRFRPVLCLLLAESFAVSPKRVLPVALAIEMVHTYSLIHDDLPCMDNSDLRRGQPTNHKKFGEGIALLAGDTLLTESFGVLAHEYSDDPKLVRDLVLSLVESIGVRGMIGGQIQDLSAQKGGFTKEQLLEMHQLKTGALIKACCQMTARACGLPQEKIDNSEKFGAALGLAFQVTDDLLDSQEALEPHSFVTILGKEGTQKFLDQVSTEAIEALIKLGLNSSRDPLLFAMVEYNRNRGH